MGARGCPRSGGSRDGDGRGRFDVLRRRPVNDRAGGRGTNVVAGGSGVDLLDDGGEGRDLLLGDRPHGSGGADDLHGTGRDVAPGDVDNDALPGGARADCLRGSHRPVRRLAGSGRDRLGEGVGAGPLPLWHRHRPARSKRDRKQRGAA